MDEFREVREAARRINDLSLKKRGPTFSSPPKTITEDLSRRLSENRRAYRAADPARHYHAKQIANMQRRIAEQGTLAERKKNVYDVRVHPSSSASHPANPAVGVRLGKPFLRREEGAPVHRDARGRARREVRGGIRRRRRHVRRRRRRRRRARASR